MAQNKNIAEVKAYKHDNSPMVEVLPISIKSVQKGHYVGGANNAMECKEDYLATPISVRVYEAKSRYHYLVMYEDTSINKLVPYDAFSTNKDCNATFVAKQLIHSDDLDWKTVYAK